LSSCIKFIVTPLQRKTTGHYNYNTSIHAVFYNFSPGFGAFPTRVFQCHDNSHVKTSQTFAQFSARSKDLPLIHLGKYHLHHISSTDNKQDNIYDFNHYKLKHIEFGHQMLTWMQKLQLYLYRLRNDDSFKQCCMADGKFVVA